MTPNTLTFHLYLHIVTFGRLLPDTRTIIARLYNEVNTHDRYL
jgi:hypothetical protein